MEKLLFVKNAIISFIEETLEKSIVIEIGAEKTINQGGKEKRELKMWQK